MVIYKIQNKINGQIYIGQTVRSLAARLGEHLKDRKGGRSGLLKKAFDAYGPQSFEISVIDHAPTQSILNEKEKYWISFYGCIFPAGYNLAIGGDSRSGWHHNEESKKKISEHQKGNTSRKGQKNSEEHRKKISEARKGRVPWIKGKKRGPCSDEVKKRISETKKGVGLSEAHKAKISSGNKGRFFLPKLDKRYPRAKMETPTQKAITILMRPKGKLVKFKNWLG